MSGATDGIEFPMSATRPAHWSALTGLGAETKDKNMDEKRTSQISEQQDNLVKQLKIMDELSTVLGERLKPVRCASVKPPSKKEEQIEQTLAPHADFLRCTAKLAENINARMGNIMDEIAC